MKDNTFSTLVSYYKEIKDIDKFTLVCKAMVCDKESTPEMRGEVAETVLYVILKDFIQKNNLKDWRISKGMVLKDPNGSSKYYTELDLTLFTPECIFSFECKSYKGEKFLADKGSLYVKKGKEFKLIMDVFDQHYKHFQTLLTNIKIGLDKRVENEKYKSFKLLYFDFADIPTEDRRDRKYKSIFPIVTSKNVYSLFNNYNERPKYWNMEIINKVVDVIEKNGKELRKNHLTYVTGLSNKRNSKR